MSVERDRAELDPLAGEGRPGAGARRAGPDPAVHGGGRLGPVDAGVVDADLGGQRDALGLLRARLDACRRRGGPACVTSRPAPPSARRPSRSPAVSVGRIRSVITPNTGPASSSLTMRNVVAPVTSSPAQIACWTGAAPRQCGQAREVQVDPAVRGDVEGGLRQQGAVRHDRAAVGRQVAQLLLEVRVAGVGGLEDRDAELLGALGDRAGHAACGRDRTGRRGG